MATAWTKIPSSSPLGYGYIADLGPFRGGNSVPPPSYIPPDGALLYVLIVTVPAGVPPYDASIFATQPYAFAYRFINGSAGSDLISNHPGLDATTAHVVLIWQSDNGDDSVPPSVPPNHLVPSSVAAQGQGVVIDDLNVPSCPKGTLKTVNFIPSHWDPYVDSGIYPAQALVESGRQRSIVGRARSSDPQTLIDHLRFGNFTSVENIATPSAVIFGIPQPSGFLSNVGWQADQQNGTGIVQTYIAEFTPAAFADALVRDRQFHPFTGSQYLRYESDHSSYVGLTGGQGLRSSGISSSYYSSEAFDSTDNPPGYVISALDPDDPITEGWLDGSSTFFPQNGLGHFMNMSPPPGFDQFSTVMDADLSYFNGVDRIVLMVSPISPAVPPNHLIARGLHFQGDYYHPETDGHGTLSVSLHGPRVSYYRAASFDDAYCSLGAQYLRLTQRADGGGIHRHPRITRPAPRVGFQVTI